MTKDVKSPGPGTYTTAAEKFDHLQRLGVNVIEVMPAASISTWRVRHNGGWRGYSDDFSDFASHNVTATAQDYDGCAARGSVEIGPYGLLILSQDP